MTRKLCDMSLDLAKYHCFSAVIFYLTFCNYYGFCLHLQTEITKNEAKLFKQKWRPQVLNGSTKLYVRKAVEFFSIHSLKKRSSVKPMTKGDNITCEEADSCDDCISFAKFDCGWCTNKDKCVKLDFQSFIPHNPTCAWQDTKWGACWVNFTALIATVCSIFGIILIIACCCVVKCCRCIVDCCQVCGMCCCGSCEEARATRQQNQKLRTLERKLDHQAKHNELVLKYGMQRNHGVPYGSTSNYQSFENTAM